MALGPEAVRSKMFTTTRFGHAGYDQGEVDAFLDEVEAALTQLHQEVATLRADNDVLRAGPATGQSAHADRTPASEASRVHEVAPEKRGVRGYQALRREDPQRVGRYSLIGRLGQGGMGTVYLGRSPGQRMVAVKVINADYADDPVFRRRFQREIETSCRVGGFYTAPVVDSDCYDNPPWLATEYIPGVPLHEVLRRHGALPAHTVHTLAAGVAEALEAIHAGGVIHRDLKPSNIIITDTGPRVIDFGIARAFDDTRLTSTHHVIGTPGFLAPEQLTGGMITSAVDVYAFGMVLCHAAGIAPFPEGVPLTATLDLLPSRLAGTITGCLESEPTRRPTPADVLRSLAPAFASTGDWLPQPVRTMINTQAAGIGTPS